MTYHLLSANDNTWITLDYHVLGATKKQSMLWESAIVLKALNYVCNLSLSCLHTHK